EVQYLYRAPLFNLVTGVGYADVNSRLDTTVDLNIPPPDGPGEFQSVDSTSTDVKHTNVYVYAYPKLGQNLIFTVGISADYLNGDSLSVKNKDQYNPKFGVEWNPWIDTTVRAAAFKVLKRTLVTGQTLEPTQVAGFNQFFDDVDASSAWRYGVGVDQKMRDLLLGAEYSKRDIKSPFIDLGDDPE